MRRRGRRGRREQTADSVHRQRAAERAETGRQSHANRQQREAPRPPLVRGCSRRTGVRRSGQSFHARRRTRRRAQDRGARQYRRLLARMWLCFDPCRLRRRLRAKGFGRGRRGGVRKSGRGDDRNFPGHFACARGVDRMVRRLARARLRGSVGLRRVPVLLHGLVPARIHSFVTMVAYQLVIVMPALVAGIRVIRPAVSRKTWPAGTSPATRCR